MWAYSIRTEMLDIKLFWRMMIRREARHEYDDNGEDDDDGDFDWIEITNAIDSPKADFSDGMAISSHLKPPV